MTKTPYQMSDLLRVMQRLRDPVSGCPWDLEQSFHSIVPSTIEECYELADAIEAENYSQIAEELGDVLFQVVFYAQLASEQDHFVFSDVVNHLVQKLVRRHPHVFASGSIEGKVSDAASIEDVAMTWEVIKQEERQGKSMHSLMDDVPGSLPALSRAQKLQRRAAQTGFDWSEISPVLDKLAEEVKELQDAMENGAASQVQEELGDVLFTVVNLARHLDKDAEASLRKANNKFERRFRAMEQLAIASGTALDQLDDDAMDALWEAAKRSAAAPR